MRFRCLVLAFNGFLFEFLWQSGLHVHERFLYRRVWVKGVIENGTVHRTYVLPGSAQLVCRWNEPRTKEEKGVNYNFQMTDSQLVYALAMTKVVGWCLIRSDEPRFFAPTAIGWRRGRG